MHRWVRLNSNRNLQSFQKQKAFFLPSNPSESIKWLDQDEPSPTYKQSPVNDKSETPVLQSSRLKPPPTRFLSDVSTSYCRQRNLAEQEARRNLGLLNCFRLFFYFMQTFYSIRFTWFDMQDLMQKMLGSQRTNRRAYL